MSPNTEPAVGQPVIHHGHIHRILAFHRKAVLDPESGEPRVERLVRFRSGAEGEGRYLVTGFAHELRWSEADGAWYLTGRVLARDERTVIAALTGAWPPAHSHLTLRAVLDADPRPLGEQVEMDKLKAVIRQRRLKQGVDKRSGERFEEAEEQFEARVGEYAEACLEHAEELRAARKARKES